MGLIDLLVRAAAPKSMPGGTPTPGSPGYNNGRPLKGLGQMPTGNVLWSSQGAGPGGLMATVGTRYSSPGQPLSMDWDATSAIEGGYFQSLWVYRCVRTIADTAAMLPIRAGLNPQSPKAHNVNAPLARLLGPPPGTPNRFTSSRTFIAWALTQYVVTGRWAWEAQMDTQQKGNDGKGLIVGLWPLEVTALQPVPSSGTTYWWEKFFFVTPTGRSELSTDQVIYSWKPSQRDWRQPESPLEAARNSIAMLVNIEKTMTNLLTNGLVGQHIVVTPPFEEAEMRRAWQDQFVQEFGGYKGAGKTIFAEAEMPESGARIPNLQIESLAMTPMDAQVLALWQQAKIDVTVDLGVPESLLGNASQRTFSNSDCLHAAEWVRLANGERRRAADLVGSVVDLWTIDSNGPRRVEAYADWNRIEPTFELTTESGRRIMANAEHPLYAGIQQTVRQALRGPVGHPRAGEEPLYDPGRPGISVLGWTPLGDLSEGHLIAVPEWLPHQGDGDLTEDEAAILGAIIGDGNSTGTAITLTSPDGPDVLAFRGAVEALGDRLTKYQTGVCDTWGVAGGTVRKLLNDHGLLKVKGADKFVPAAVFAARREVQVRFLQALYAADGCANVSKPATYGGKREYGRAFVNLTSISSELLRDVQELLLRFGINSRIIHQRHRGGLPNMGDRIFESYRLCVDMAPDVIVFCQDIGIPAKQEQVDRTLAVANEAVKRGRLRTWRKLRLPPGLRWERVTSIVPIGTAQTVKIYVPDGNTYLGMMWEHNSEYRNFWTITMLDVLREQEDHINTNLAPRLGNEVAWFDVSKVVALQPPPMFSQLDPADLVASGIATPQQMAQVLDIPDMTSVEETPEDAPIGEEAPVVSVSRSAHPLAKRASRSDTTTLARIYELLERPSTKRTVPGKRLDDLERWFNDKESWLEKAANGSGR